jgi:DNA-binding transcriptional LysR family regulator
MRMARAALALGVSPPAVSQQLARLEREVGAVLVERGTRGARLTELGELLARHGARVADELAAATETAADYLGTHLNRLRIGAPPSLSTTLLPAALAATRYRTPAAELSVVDVMSDDGPRLVRDAVLDVALAARYTSLPEADGVAVHHLADDDLIAVLPDDHPQAASGVPLDLAELADAQWASGSAGRPSRVQLEDLAADAGFVPRVPFVTESYDVVQALADAGVAVGLVPRLALTRHLGTTTSRCAPRSCAPSWRSFRQARSTCRSPTGSSATCARSPAQR